jgi:hypothetical protein
LPILDTVRPVGQGHETRDGGLEVTLASSPNDGRGKVQALALGERRTIDAFDSPRNTFPRRNVFPEGFELRSFEIKLGFKTWCVGWTNSIGEVIPTPNAGNSVGFRTFSAFIQDTWEVTAEYKVVAPAAAGKNYTLQAVVPKSTKLTASDLVNSPGRASDENLELRPPVPLQVEIEVVN